MEGAESCLQETECRSEKCSSGVDGRREGRISTNTTCPAGICLEVTDSRLEEFRRMELQWSRDGRSRFLKRICALDVARTALKHDGPLKDELSSKSSPENNGRSPL